MERASAGGANNMHPLSWVRHKRKSSVSSSGISKKQDFHNSKKQETRIFLPSISTILNVLLSAILQR